MSKHDDDILTDKQPGSWLGRRVDDAVTGAVAGAIATVPMTLVMGRLHKELPPQEQYPLPPRQITEEIAERVDVRDEMGEEETAWATLAAHFAYGAAMGAAYAVMPRFVARPGLTGGVTYGLGVWSGSYLGWLPRLGILPPATEQPPRRSGLMIAAHVVWGLAFGVMLGVLRRK